MAENTENAKPTLIRLENSFSVCKLSSIAGVDFSQRNMFLSVTDDEISLVCETFSEPTVDIVCAERGFKAFKISGELDFGLVGIIARITAILSEAAIGVFVISTYNTDYILVKENRFDQASELLKGSGYKMM